MSDKIGKIKFKPGTQPGVQSRFGNFAFNRFFGDLQTSGVKKEKASGAFSFPQVKSPEEFFGSKQIDQVIPSRAYKRGKKP